MRQRCGMHPSVHYPNISIFGFNLKAVSSCMAICRSIAWVQSGLPKYGVLVSVNLTSIIFFAITYTSDTVRASNPDPAVKLANSPLLIGPVRV